MINIYCCEESLNPLRFFKWLKNRIEFRKAHPEYFDADGLVCFFGPQGSGKTLSAVNYVYRLMDTYPSCKLVTNIMLRDYPIVTFDDYLKDNKRIVNCMIESGIEEDEIIKSMYSVYLDENRVFEFNDNDDFAKYSNGEKGVIFLVDEIQLYLNSLQSKNINMEVMTQISQQRKQRKHIVATSQVFGRMAKPLREQFSCAIACRSLFKCIQVNSMIDRDSIEQDNSNDMVLKGTVKKKFIWFHLPEYYKRYDTYYVIEKAKFVSGENQTNIYDIISEPTN